MFKFIEGQQLKGIVGASEKHEAEQGRHGGSLFSEKNMKQTNNDVGVCSLKVRGTKETFWKRDENFRKLTRGYSID